MNAAIESLLTKAKETRSQATSNGLTFPRTWGTYELTNAGQSRRFRYGNHPIRQKELAQEFGACKVVATFYSQDEAHELANLLNISPL
ncbi:MAG: hypothetical protein LBV49_06760 [Azonexus sp.]|jgi:hypothetical protein|nr:hypothetical protein [Azonexus sp.]